MTNCRSEIYLELRQSVSDDERNLQFLKDEFLMKGRDMDRTIVVTKSIAKTTSLNIIFRDMLPDKGRIYENGNRIGYICDHYSSSTGDNTKKCIFKTFADPCSHLRVLFCTISYGLGKSVS
jgi:hypothetical protein